MNRMFGSAAILVSGLWLAAPAHAANDVMKQCGAKYQAAKAGNTLGGKNWAQFLAAQCRGAQTWRRRRSHRGARSDGQAYGARSGGQGCLPLKARFAPRPARRARRWSRCTIASASAASSG